jgi:small subunit ribosomal protein S4
VPGRKNLYPSHQWYKNRLAAKQRIRVELGCIKDYQLKKLFRSTQNNGQKDYSILQKIECRLDIVLYRLGFSNSIHCSHQFINHGYIRVNGIRTRSKNIILERGDCIDIEPRYWETVSKKIKTFLREKPFFSPPPMYLETNYKLLTSTLLKEPKLTDLYYNTILDIESTKYFYKRG